MVSIKLERVSLLVPIYLQRERNLRSWASALLGATFDPPKRDYARILDDVSFEAHEGDRVAILGRNGAGKSTLLRVLNGVYTPTSGQISVTGTRQALLNISLGFNPHATVRENIFLRGTAMGIRAADLRDHIEDILDFAGLRQKAGHRLHTLSSGQKMRLGFAISTCFQHDIMLMDEWVGTGDADFMVKATNRLQNRMGGSKIVMLASHSVGLLRDICSKGVVIERGRMVFAGDIASSLKYYHELQARLREQPEYLPDSVQADGSAIYGCVENITVENGGVALQGWFVTNTGARPRGLVMEHAGVRYAADRIDAYARPDVMKHFSLADDQCGFRARFEVPGLHSLSDLDGDLQVHAGLAAQHASSALRIAGAGTRQLANAS